MKEHFEYMPLPLSIAVNSAAGIAAVLPAAFACSCFFSSSHERACGRHIGALILLAVAAAVFAVNKIIVYRRKKHTEPDLTVSEKSAQRRAALSAAAALLPPAAAFCDPSLTVPAVCTGLAVFVFAFTLHFTDGHDSRS